MAKTTTKRRHPEHDLGEALDEARGRLSSDEFERVAALLMVWYSLFYIVAAAGDRADDEEIEVLDKSERRRPE